MAIKILVVSDDAIVRAGLEVLAPGAGLSVKAIPSAAFGEQTHVSFDLIMVWQADDRVDSLWAVEEVTALLRQGRRPGMPPVVCVLRQRSSDLLLLRLCELGVTHVITRRKLNAVLEREPDHLTPALIKSLKPLGRPADLRARCALRPNGELAPLLSSARNVPPVVWTTTATESEVTLPLTQGQIAILRAIAGQVAGIPPRDAVAATGGESAGKLPEWVTVRRAVREAMGIIAR